MKKNFIAGLTILLPIALTIMIVGFLINLITSPFLGTVSTAFDFYGIFNEPFLFLSASKTLMLSSKIFILLFLFLIILLVGVLGQMFLIKHLGRLGDYIFHRIPGFNKIYKSIQDIVHTLFMKSKQKASFSHVVLVPFPHAKMYSIGLITNSTMSAETDAEHNKNVSVFVPGTPNPAMGFMLLFQKDKLVPLDITVEEAIKFIISIGVVFPRSAREPIQQDISAK